MDRQISNAVQRKRRFGRWGRVALIVVGVIAALWAFRYFLQPSTDSRELNIAVVKRGDMKNTVTATGMIVAGFEEQLNAPVSTTIEKVMLPVGKEVKAGDLILSLDREYVQLDLNGRRDQLALKSNNVDLLKLEYDRDIQELDYNAQIKALELSTAEAQLADARRLLQIGGATAEEVEAAELQVKIIRLEENKLTNELNYRRNSLAGRRKNLELEVAIQSKEVTQLSRKLRETEVRAPRPGVVTWINESIGQQVAEGAPLVRIANLGSYRMEASCADRYADQLEVGLRVDIELAKAKLTGTVTSILPEVENNTMRFLVAFDEPDHPALRPNLRAQIEVISGEKPGVMMVKRGSAFRGGVRQNVFVVRGEEAVATDVTLGMRNGDFIEIVSGVQPGDRLIISDLPQYRDVQRFSLN